RNSRIRKVTAATGFISTVAGNGTPGYVASDDNGTTAATAAELNFPTGIAVDGAGNLYIADSQNDRIRKVTAATGTISTVAGNGTNGYLASDDNGTTAATAAELNGPEDVVVDGAGNLYIADLDNSRIRKVTAATGFISTIAGNGTQGYLASDDNGTTAATAAELDGTFGIVVDGAGNLYIADYQNNRIRKVTAATGFISTVAGNGTQGYLASDDNGTTAATAAELNFPTGIAVDGAGNLYIAEDGNSRIRKVTAATGTISTVAGNGTPGYVASDDNGTTAATAAELGNPEYVAVDGAGNLYLSDSGNSRIRKVTAAAAPVAFATATPVGTSDSTDGAQKVIVNNVGNTALTFPAPGTIGTFNPGFSRSNFSYGGSSTCTQVGSSSSSFSLAAGDSCTELISFAPVQPGVISENVISTDNSLNVMNATQAVALSATATVATGSGVQTITFPQPVTPAQTGTTTTLTATSDSGLTILYSVLSGPATIIGSTVTYTGAGTVVIEADQYGNNSYEAASPIQRTVTVGNSVGVVGPTQTAMVTMTTTGVLGRINVLTQGVSGADFKLVAGGTCAIGNPYNLGQTCTVLYSFTPSRPGQRSGGISLTTGSGSTATVL
ncbi:MAG: hypothetical protein ABI142_08815, partial [Bryocella sp.]